MEGVVVKEVQLKSRKEGYAYLSVGEGSGITLMTLKEAVKKTPFELIDTEWLVK